MREAQGRERAGREAQGRALGLVNRRRERNRQGGAPQRTGRVALMRDRQDGAPQQEARKELRALMDADLHTFIMLYERGSERVGEHRPFMEADQPEPSYRSSVPSV